MSFQEILDMMNEIYNRRLDEIYNRRLDEAIQEAFPVIYGVPGSWAAVMDFVDDYEAQYPRGFDIGGATVAPAA